jgi:hypothetical protein
MIEFVFTLDYEIYGDGQGTLGDLVYEPAEQLAALFLHHGVRFVSFVEVAELQKIDEAATDPAIDSVKRQIRRLRDDGFEIGLHLHPQWCNARYRDGRWEMDVAEYNLCTLPHPRIAEIVDGAVGYLRDTLGDRSFAPLSFRAGNWLFQPTQAAARLLADNGIRIDTSVFKGGVIHHHGIDYRPSLTNGDFWRFDSEVCDPAPSGVLIEVPIHTRMVRPWNMPTSKRIALANGRQPAGRSTSEKVNRLRDLARFRYPLKLDFCRMTLKELTSMVGNIVEEDRAAPGLLRPVVAIGHTKDAFDLETVDRFLTYLQTEKIGISTFADLYSNLARSLPPEEPR